MELRTPPATAKGPATTFTGDVWSTGSPAATTSPGSSPSTVRFTPGARTALALTPSGTDPALHRGSVWSRPATAG